MGSNGPERFENIAALLETALMLFLVLFPSVLRDLIWRFAKDRMNEGSQQSFWSPGFLWVVRLAGLAGLVFMLAIFLLTYFHVGSNGHAHE